MSRKQLSQDALNALLAASLLGGNDWLEALEAHGRELLDAHMELRLSVRRMSNERTKRAQHKLECAIRSKEEIGKRVMQHGAFCDANSALELRAAIGEPIV